MPVYAYKGVTDAGRNTKGFVDADSDRTARSKLRRDGIFLTELVQSGADSLPATRASSRPGEIARWQTDPLRT